jgi:DNA-nicking Smr family endonuclease
MAGDWTDRYPDAVFDLHGQSVIEAATNALRFLKAQARARPGGVVRLVTGRGRGGGGAPIRTRVRTLLRMEREDGGVVADYFLEDSEGSFLIRLR